MKVIIMFIYFNHEYVITLIKNKSITV